MTEKTTEELTRTAMQYIAEIMKRESLDYFSGLVDGNFVSAQVLENRHSGTVIKIGCTIATNNGIVE